MWLHLEFLVRWAMLIFCGIWPHGRILSLIDGLTALSVPMVERLLRLLLSLRLVLFGEFLVAIFELVSGPLIILRWMSSCHIAADSNPLLDTVVLQIVGSLRPHLLLLLLKLCGFLLILQLLAHQLLVLMLEEVTIARRLRVASVRKWLSLKYHRVASMIHCDWVHLLLGAFSLHKILVELALSIWQILRLYDNLILNDLLLLNWVDQVILLQVGLTIGILCIHESKTLTHAVGVRLKTLYIFEVHVAACGDKTVTVDWAQVGVVPRRARCDWAAVLLLKLLVTHLVANWIVVLHYDGVKWLLVLVKCRCELS